MLYGGTKEEMERLIKDANKLAKAQGKAGELTIDSYADVVEAIHLVQEEMGITGTTAKEAEDTIQGSLASMKSAWKNVLVAMADSNADFEGSVEEFVDTVEIAADNLLPVVKNALNGITKLVDTLLPQILSAIPGFVADLLPTLTTTVTNLLTNLGAMLPDLIVATFSNIPNLIMGIFDGLDGFFSGLMESIFGKTDMATDRLVDLRKQAEELNTSIAAASEASYDAMLESTAEIDAAWEKWNQLNQVVGKNGEIATEDQSKVQIWLDTLNEVFGLNLTITNGVIEGWGNATASMAEYYERSRAEAILASQEEEYQERLKATAETVELLEESMAARNQAEMEFIEAVGGKGSDVYQKYTENLQAGMSAAQAASDAIENSRSTMGAGSSALLTYADALEQADMALMEQYTVWEQNNAWLEEYEAQKAALLDGDYEKVKFVNESTLLSLQTTNLETKAANDAALLELQSNYNAKLQMQSEFGVTANATELEQYEQSIALRTQYNTTYTALVQSGFSAADAETLAGYGMMFTTMTNANVQFGVNAEGNINAYVDGIKALSNVPVDEMETIMNNIVTEMHRKGETTIEGEDFIQGLIDGMLSKEDDVIAAADDNSAWAQDALHKGLGNGSPSEDAKQEGRWYMEGFVIGMEDKRQSIWDKAWGLAKHALNSLSNALDEHSPSKEAAYRGEMLGEGLALGIEDGSDPVMDATYSLVDDINGALDDINSDIELNGSYNVDGSYTSYDQASALVSGARAITSASSNSGMDEKLENIITLLNAFLPQLLAKEGVIKTADGATFATWATPYMDKSLAQYSNRKARA